MFEGISVHFRYRRCNCGSFVGGFLFLIKLDPHQNIPISARHLDDVRAVDRKTGDSLHFYIRRKNINL